MLGPGKYDAECTYVREKLDADGVIIIVFKGEKDGGFSCQAPLDVLLRLPTILRKVAKQIEEDGTL